MKSSWQVWKKTLKVILLVQTLRWFQKVKHVYFVLLHQGRSSSFFWKYPSFYILQAVTVMQLLKIYTKRETLPILFLIDHLSLKCDLGQRFSTSNFPHWRWRERSFEIRIWWEIKLLWDSRRNRYPTTGSHKDHQWASQKKKAFTYNLDFWQPFAEQIKLSRCDS